MIRTLYFIAAIALLSGCKSTRQMVTERVTLRDTTIVVPEAKVFAKLELRSFSIGELRSDSFLVENYRKSRFVFIPDTVIEANSNGIRVLLRADSGKVTVLATKEKQEIKLQTKEIERIIYVENEPKARPITKILMYVCFLLGLSILMILILKLM